MINPLNKHCNKCNETLKSVYVRNKKSFWSLKELWYCVKCDIIYKYEMVEKEITIQTPNKSEPTLDDKIKKEIDKDYEN